MVEELDVMNFKGPFPNHSVMLRTGIQSSEHSTNMAKLVCVANSTKMQHIMNTMTANSCVQLDNSTQHFASHTNSEKFHL